MPPMLEQAVAATFHVPRSLSCHFSCSRVSNLEVLRPGSLIKLVVLSIVVEELLGG